MPHLKIKNLLSEKKITSNIHFAAPSTPPREAVSSPTQLCTCSGTAY